MHSQGLLDGDLDGDLDIVAIEKEGDTQFYCYKNNGYDDSENIQFVNSYSYSRSDDSSSSRTLAIVDFDNDGDQDVYIPRKLDKNWLFVNQTLTKSGDEIIYNSNPEELFIEVSSVIISINRFKREKVLHERQGKNKNDKFGRDISERSLRRITHTHEKIQRKNGGYKKST